MSARRIGFRVPEQLLLPWSPRTTVSVTHAAELLGSSESTILRMIEAGELMAYQLRKRSPWRINYDSLLSYVERIHKEHGLETRF